MSKITQEDLKEITDFVYCYYGCVGSSYQDLMSIIEKHIEYDTFIIVRDDYDDIVAAARWNVLPNGTDLVILDVIIHPEHRRINLMHRMVQKGLAMYPTLKYIIYERHDRGRNFRKIPLAKLLKRRF